MFTDLILTELSDKLIIGALFFVRIGGIMAASPIFRSPAIPMPVKVFFSVILAIMLTAAFGNDQPIVEFHLWFLTFLVIKEVLVGAIIGFTLDMVFQAARYAGGMIDFEMGYHTSSLFDISSTTPSIVGELKAGIILILFFFIDGHHFIIESLFASARAVPLTTFAITESTYTILIRLITSITIIAVKMAAPVLVALFLTNLSLALLAKIAPQTNIFILSFTLKITVGLLIMMASIPLFVIISKYALTEFQSETMKIIMSINPGRV